MRQIFILSAFLIFSAGLNAQSLTFFLPATAFATVPDVRIRVNGQDVCVLKENEFFTGEIAGAKSLKIELLFPKFTRTVEKSEIGTAPLYLKINYLLDDYSWLTESDGIRLSKSSSFKQLQATEAVNRLKQSPVPEKQVSAKDPESRGLLDRGEGAGFLVDENGWILTDYSLVGNNAVMMVGGLNGDYNTLFSAEVFATDQRLGLALLRLRNENLGVGSLNYSLANSNAHQSGAVYLATLNSNRELLFSESSVDPGYRAISDFRINRGVNPVRAGSPVFGENGQIIGLAHENYTVTTGEFISYFLKNAGKGTTTIVSSNQKLPLTSGGTELRGKVLRIVSQ